MLMLSSIAVLTAAINFFNGGGLIEVAQLDNHFGLNVTNCGRLSQVGPKNSAKLAFALSRQMELHKDVAGPCLLFEHIYFCSTCGRTNLRICPRTNKGLSCHWPNHDDFRSKLVLCFLFLGELRSGWLFALSLTIHAFLTTSGHLGVLTLVSVFFLPFLSCPACGGLPATRFWESWVAKEKGEGAGVYLASMCFYIHCRERPSKYISSSGSHKASSPIVQRTPNISRDDPLATIGSQYAFVKECPSCWTTPLWLFSGPCHRLVFWARQSFRGAPYKSVDFAWPLGWEKG